MTRGGSIAMLALGATLMLLGAEFVVALRLRFVAFGPEPGVLSYGAALAMMALGASVAGWTLARVAGDVRGRVGGIESTRGVVAWTLVSFGVALAMTWVSASAGRHSATAWPYSVPAWRDSTAFALAITTTVSAVALAPWATTPILLADPRVSLREAIAVSAIRFAASSLPRLVAGALVAAALPIGVPAAAVVAGFAFEHAGCLGLAAYAGAAALVSAAMIEGLTRLAQDARGAALVFRAPRPPGTLALAAPMAVAFGVVVREARVLPWSTTTGLLCAIALLASLALAWALVQRARHRSQGPAADTTRVTFRARDVEVDERRENRLRAGAELTLANGACVKAPALLVDGLPIETPPEDVVDAWLAVPLARQATYRVAPTTLPEDAVLNVGTPAAAEERRTVRMLARVLPPVAGLGVALVLATGLSLAPTLEAPTRAEIDRVLRLGS